MTAFYDAVVWSKSRQSSINRHFPTVEQAVAWITEVQNRDWLFKDGYATVFTPSAVTE